MRSKGLFGAITLVVVGIIFGAILVSGFSLVRPDIANVKLGAAAPPVTLMQMHLPSVKLLSK